MHTIACRDEDFTAWHGGCRHALVWALDVDVPPVREAVAAARERWQRFLLPRYERQPHITLAYGGPVMVPGALPMDPPYSRHDVERAVAGLHGLGLQPFDVQVTGWGTFPMSPYLAATAPELEVLGRYFERADFRPHITVGHYAHAGPVQEVAALCAGWDRPHVPPVRVEDISLMRYETHDIAGSLTTIGRFHLASASWSGSQDQRHDDQE